MAADKEAARRRTCRHSSSRLVRCSSGSWKDASWAAREREYRWNATPGWHRPARPRRCFSLAADVHVDCNGDEMAGVAET